MIVGIGIDIIDINRIRNVINKYGDKFKTRCFHKNEIFRSEKRYNSVESYAKRYAAKEACSKALGTGFSNSVYWKDIEVVNNKYGKPELFLHNGAKTMLENLLPKNTIGQIDLSITDEYPYAQATVIITCTD